MRLAVLWSCLSGYLVAGLRELHSAHGVETLLVHRPEPANFPFRLPGLDGICNRVDRTSLASHEELLRVATDYEPDAVLVAGWMDRGYLRAAYELKRAGKLVIGCMDNQWRGSARQTLALYLLGCVLRATYSVMWVPGERAALYAKKLGFSGKRLWRGMYGISGRELSRAGEARFESLDKHGEWPRSFLFLGQYVERKGLRDLLTAYGLYRQNTVTPWQLWVAGSGPLKPLVANRNDVNDLGFVQPAQLPSLLASVGCFVLPSRRDAWPLALVEAAASGLPIICTDECGSSVEVVRDCYNGLLVAPRDIPALARALHLLSEMCNQELGRYGRRSAALASTYSSEQWASYLLRRCREFWRAPTAGINQNAGTDLDD